MRRHRERRRQGLRVVQIVVPDDLIEMLVETGRMTGEERTDRAAVAEAILAAAIDAVCEER